MHSKSWLLAVALSAGAPSAYALDCQSSQVIDETLPSGSRWEMCWQQRQAEGVTYTDGHFTSAGGVRRKVFKELSVAAIEIEFDEPSSPMAIVSGPGLGGAQLVQQSAAMCAGTLVGNPSSICRWVDSRGYIYKYYQNQRQGHALKLQSLSINGPSTYVLQWSFSDDGSIEPRLGLTGELPSVGNNSDYGWPVDDSGNVGVGFTSHYTWRLDLDIGSNSGRDLVEEISAQPTADRARKTKSITPILVETGRALDADTKRSWRIKDTVINNSDGRDISYHLEPLQYSHRSVANAPAWRAQDVFFTAYNSCERLAQGNDTANGCAASLDQFINGQSINSTDLVLWYTISYHHLPRSEDLDGIKATWSGFSIVPRDWDATNPLGGS